MIAPLPLVLALLVAAQEPSDPAPQRRARQVRVHSDVRVIVEESPEGEYERDHYEQQLPVEYRGGVRNLGSRVWFHTVCRPQEDDRIPVFYPPPPPFTPPISISGSIGAPRFNVTTRADLSTIVGITRNDPIITKPSTKPALFGGGGSGASSSSDAPLLYGPDFDLLLASDVSGWSAAQWMPADTALHLYARILFGSVEVFDTTASLQLYGIGPRLTLPFVKTDSLDFGLSVSAGPAFLHTEIGDAVGFDGGIGLRFEQIFAPGFSFVAAVEANLYVSENVTAFGPLFNLGFNLSW